MSRAKKPEQLPAQALGQPEAESRSEHQCKICTHPLRGEIDEMIAAGVRYSSIMKFASERGLQLSNSGVSRHKTTHLNNPDSDVAVQLRSALKKHLERCLRELKRRDVESFSVGELIAEAQATIKALRTPS